MIEVHTDKRGVLNPTEQAKYEAALRQSHTVSTRIALYDQDEKHVVDLLGSGSKLAFIGGQVDIDTTNQSGPWRQLHVALLDPKKKLHLVAKDQPADYQIWADTFIGVERGDWVSAFGEFVWCPVFFGPVTSFARSGIEVEIVAEGKELLALDPYLLFRSLHVKRGRKVTDAIRELLQRQGEANFNLGNNPAKLHHAFVAPRLSAAWPAARKLAKGVDASCVLFYDGKGRLCMPKKSTKGNKVWNFDTGANGAAGCLLSVPDSTYDFTAFRNFADVTGAAPTKKRPQPHAGESISAHEELAPGSLSRHGTARYSMSVVNDSQIGTQVKAQKVAKDTLTQVKDIGWDAAFDSLPIPHLEEKDWVWVDDGDGGQFPIQMNKWSIPLGGDSMSVGLHRQGKYTRNLKPVRLSRAHYHKPTKHKSH